MGKLFSIILTGIIVSFYFFPFEFVFLPGVNTKMALAGMGLLVLGLQLAKQGGAVIRKDLMFLSLVAAVVSLIGLASVTYNNTIDYTYVTYIISMWVWLSGAYVAVSCIRWVHGQVSVKLVCDYLVGICVAQCLLALLIDFYYPFKALVDSMVQGFDFVDISTMESAERLYGIGAGLDVAGTRFAVVLLMIAYWVLRCEKRSSQVLYILAFMIIAVVGNMIGRTTTLGVVLSIFYWIYASEIYRFHWDKKNLAFWRTFVLIALAFVPVVVYLYLSVPEMYNNIRFAFEGFFSLVEQGKWSTNSNDILKRMFVLPETWRTWIIGDGYFDNPYALDPNYVGPRWGGFYKATDIGYLRFIFYFGLIGMLTFCYFFYRVGKNCMDRFSNHRMLFLMILTVHFIVWCKVSTDLYVVFALFLVIGTDENEEYEKRMLQA